MKLPARLVDDSVLAPSFRRQPLLDGAILTDAILKYRYILALPLALHDLGAERRGPTWRPIAQLALRNRCRCAVATKQGEDAAGTGLIRHTAIFID